MPDQPLGRTGRPLGLAGDEPRAMGGVGFPAEAWEQLVRFETHLKAIERFFNLENHPARSGGPVGLQDNMATEVGVAERQFRRLIQLGRGILNEADANVLAFRTYIESEWVSDSARDALLTEFSDQKTWRDSLFLLLEGLQSLATLAAGLRTARQVSVASFRALAQQFRALMVHNRFFNPMRAHPMFLFAERLTHPVLRRAVAECETGSLRRALALALSFLMRYLRILSWVESGADNREALLDALPLLALLRSDFVTLRPYLEKTFSRRFMLHEGAAGPEGELRARIDGFCFELQVEARKAFESFLFDFTQTNNVKRMRGALEAAHGLLTTLLEQAVVSLVAIALPGVSDRDIFPGSTMRHQQSLRLREDLWLFGEVLRHVTKSLLSDAAPDDKRNAYKGLLDFLTYFEHLSLQLLRFWDRDPFEQFCRDMRALRDERFTDPVRCEDIANNFECFRVFIETILGLVNLRADLRASHLDEVRARRALLQFVRCA